MASRNINAKNRKIRGRFAMIPLDVLRHPAVSTLGHAPFRVLVLLAGAYNGRNNGALGITANQAKEQGIGSPVTFYSALRQLEKRGLIERLYPASRVPARPTMYGITWKPLNDTDYSKASRTAANAYREWQP